jgi:hypothetical protein
MATPTYSQELYDALKANRLEAETTGSQKSVTDYFALRDKYGEIAVRDAEKQLRQDAYVAAQPTQIALQNAAKQASEAMTQKAFEVGQTQKENYVRAVEEIYAKYGGFQPMADDRQKQMAIVSSSNSTPDQITQAKATLAGIDGLAAGAGSALRGYVSPTGGTFDNTKLNTQGGESALSTGDINKIATSPVATSSPNTMNTGSIPALTTADLTNWYNTQPKGITADQLKTALEGQQTALSGQNTEFLKNWNSSADALKTNILSGVDTKNQAFGTQATQGFMDAFKNFQIPTNQQTGVNMGNYNDNRNAAADQWWSQYVTGRR